MHHQCVILAGRQGGKGEYGLRGLEGWYNWCVTCICALQMLTPLGLTRSLAAEVGPMGVRINAILPGYIETQMTQGMRSII